MEENIAEKKLSGIEKIMSEGVLGPNSTAKSFGHYNLSGKIVRVTQEILQSEGFQIKNLSMYHSLPGNYHGSRSLPNFHLDIGIAQRLEEVVSKYVLKFAEL